MSAMSAPLHVPSRRTASTFSNIKVAVFPAKLCRVGMRSILAKFLFSSSKINNCQLYIHVWVCPYPFIQATAFSGTSIKDRGNSQTVTAIYDGRRRRNHANWKVGKCRSLAKMVSFHPFNTGCILTISRIALALALSFCLPFFLAPCVLPGFLLPPPAFAARYSDDPTSAEANTIDVGGSPQCRHKFVNQHGLPPIVEAMVRLRATLTSRGYFQHVPRETC